MQEEAAIAAIIEATRKAAQLEILQWAMRCCSSGYPSGMIRMMLHNKAVEISGEGERA